ncbi:15-hydroxyprostaglandin dehydrogenase [Colletotrichum siamense]|uniref:15-hydroxyprostaglandin dehydrogenase n=1 Tax=Colletotrichum siamense TaxID=690259 RepID=UPI0018725059|nr:15-hydroxyprostaglandin dehydrogenase [Colletotrichum siamense]KAF5501060.1 15-hydroxyprostaglandin dehydrogenase [Colletotrichum siamense]
MDVNVTGTWNMATEAIQRMMTQENIEAPGTIPGSVRSVGQGSVVNVGSGASLRGVSGLAAYTASKHAVLGLTRAWARDFPKMRVNMVAPGATDTPLAEATVAGAPKDDPNVVVGKAQIASIPKGRMAFATDIADAIIFLLSDWSSFITGQCLPVAIVTGAASGIGKALATNLITKGWRVACCDLQKDAGNAVASELGDHAVFYELDVCDYDAQAKVFSQVWDRWGRLDALLANAGHSDRGSIYIFDHRGKDDITPKPALKSIKACYESFLYGVQLAIHFMRRNVVPGGQIIATSTIASVHPHQTFPEYCGAKAAINHFVRTAAPLLKLKENIAMNAVLPGIVITGAVPQASINATKPEQ